MLMRASEALNQTKLNKNDIVDLEIVTAINKGCFSANFPDYMISFDKQKELVELGYKVSSEKQGYLLVCWSNNEAE